MPKNKSKSKKHPLNLCEPNRSKKVFKKYKYKAVNTLYVNVDKKINNVNRFKDRKLSIYNLDRYISYFSNLKNAKKFINENNKIRGGHWVLLNLETKKIIMK